ncbi:MAG TPA: flavin reductase family protein [Azospira sp.]|nr:flavin reductase family protein [Azospira sp.]
MSSSSDDPPVRNLAHSHLPCPACDDGPVGQRTDADYDCRAFRDALGSFATGIAVVTACAADGEFIGLTINSFNSVSLDPPLVLWSLDLASPNLEAFSQASHYVVNILAADQEAVSQHFATRQPDKFGDLQLCLGAGSAPLLHGCCAWFECANETRYPGGDHLIFLGRVERFTHDPQRAPLLYHGGRYRHLARD